VAINSLYDGKIEMAKVECMFVTGKETKVEERNKEIEFPGLKYRFYVRTQLARFVSYTLGWIVF
jgi:hypothetical protein